MKKVYIVPEAMKFEFNYSENVAASGSGRTYTTTDATTQWWECHTRYEFNLNLIMKNRLKPVRLDAMTQAIGGISNNKIMTIIITITITIITTITMAAIATGALLGDEFAVNKLGASAPSFLFDFF